MGNFEEILVKERWVSPNELIKAREDQKKTGKSLFCSFIKLGYMSEEDVFLFFAENSSIPFVKLSNYIVDEEVLKILPEHFYL